MYWAVLDSVLAITRTTVDASGLSRIGLLSSLTFSRRVGNWELSGSGNYYQNTQTLLVGYTTSGFGFTAAVGRKIGYLHWNGSAGGSRSLLNTTAGYGSHSQNYATGLSAKWFGVSASYAKSDGTALLGGTGLVPTPLPNPIPLPTDIIVYGGHSYGGGLGLNPFKRFTASASFSRSHSVIPSMARWDRTTTQKTPLSICNISFGKCGSLRDTASSTRGLVRPVRLRPT